MENRISLLLIFFFLLTFGIESKGQEIKSDKNVETLVDLQRTIKLEDDSKSEDIIIVIKPGTLRFNLMINSSVNSGMVTIEIYDPKATKQGTYSVGTQVKSDKKELATGSIEKTLKEPLSGNWKVKIVPSKATGTINIHSTVVE